MERIALKDIHVKGRTIIKKNSVLIRFWHWASALMICGSLLTVFLNSTLLDHENARLVKYELLQAGVKVNSHQSIAVIHGMEEQVWGFHIYFGYALAILLVFRMVSEAFQLKQQRLFKKLAKVYRNYLIERTHRRRARHELFKRIIYLAYYLLLALMVLSGLTIAFTIELGLSRSFSHQLKEFHGFLMYLIIAFIIIHIFGVFLAERKEGKGIVSDMINGGEIN